MSMADEGTAMDDSNGSTSASPNAGYGGEVGENRRRSSFWAQPNGDAAHLNTFLQRESKRCARNPCIYMCSSVILITVLSVVGLVVGEFAIEIENVGWWSRGTATSSRQRQWVVMNYNRYNLAFNESAWDVVTDPDADHVPYEDIVYSAPFVPEAMAELSRRLDQDGAKKPKKMRELLDEAAEGNQERRQLEQDDAQANVLSGCDMRFYDRLSGGNLWPLWKIPDKEYTSTDTRTVLDADVLEAICVAETNTQAYLEENGLCDVEGSGCDNGRCMPPYSIVLYARLVVEGGMDVGANGGHAMDCKGLSAAWTPDLQEYIRYTWIQDIKDLKILLTPSSGSTIEKEDPRYPYGYYPALVQSDFDTNGGRSQFTSSIFDTRPVTDGDELYEVVENFDRAEDSDVVMGAYDTGWDEMAEIKVDSLLTQDMSLACASAVIISVAIIVHTQSPLITALGLLQIVLSFPMGFFVYKLIFRFAYFPFLNFIGVFVVFALGAGDIFVAFDKWTNYRKNNINKSTEYVAAYALPESLNAMFLTTSTTAVAFFATAVCPVAPIKMFAIFCGLLILFDYFLTVLFVFPALCIYDRALINRNAGTQTNRFWLGLIGCGTCFRCCAHTAVYDEVVVGDYSGSERTANDEDKADETERYSASQRFCLWLSNILVKARWPLLGVCVVSFAVCIYFATKLGLPESSDVRLLKPNIQYEQNYMWRKELLAADLSDLSGSNNRIIWGLEQSDTGKQTDPYDGTALVFDDTFDPSSEEAQIYLRDFCDKLWESDISLPPEDYVCPMNEFDQWLKDIASSGISNPDFESICGSPNGIPVDPDKFNGCMRGWAMFAQNFDVIFDKDDVMRYMEVRYRNTAVFTDRYSVLEEQRKKIEEFVDNMNENAPEGVNNIFSNGLTFHWHDTNKSIQRTAYSSAGIALVIVSGIMLLSCRSVVLTIFSTTTILFILTSVTSILAALGWTLGFLESICFSILIGVSVDFVIHFTHAYVHDKGEVSREERTKYSLVTMGPSIIATAVTTFFSAVIMLFCVITFFRKFALVLFLTVVMATLSSFVFFITLTNCFGPTNPTYLVDKCIAFCLRKEYPPSNDNDKLSRDGDRQMEDEEESSSFERDPEVDSQEIDFVPHEESKKDVATLVSRIEENALS